MGIFKKLIFGILLCSLISVGTVALFVPLDNTVIAAEEDDDGLPEDPCPDGNCLGHGLEEHEEDIAPEVAKGGFKATVIKVVNYLLTFVGLLAIIALIYSGVLWITSGGDEGQFTKGKKGVLYAALGLILIIFSYTIVNWIINFGDVDVPATTPTTVDDGGGTTTTDGGGGGTTDDGDNTGTSTGDDKTFQDQVDDVSNNVNDLSPTNIDKIDTGNNAQTVRSDIDDLYGLAPHTDDMNDAYNQLVASLDQWKKDPTSEAKKKDFDDRYAQFLELLESFPVMTAIIKASPVRGNAPLFVSLDALDSSDPNNFTIPTENYKWSYIDNTGQVVDLGAGPIKDLTLEEAGTFVINLTVATANLLGGKKTAIDGVTSIRIMVLPPSSKVDFKVNGETATSFHKITLSDAVEGVSFDPSPTVPSQGRTITEWIWEFGDGINESYTQIETAIHKYSSTGNYRVKLQVEDNVGTKDSKEITLQVQDIVADISISPDKGTVENTFTFNAERSEASVGEIKLYKWEITGPEKVESDREIFSYVFTTPGDYEARLTVTDEAGKQETAIESFKVHSRSPNATFEWSVHNKSKPSVVYFNASRSSDPADDKLTYSWDFDGDGTFDVQDSADNNVQHSYEEVNIYPVTLMVKDEFGEVDTLLRNVEITSIFDVDFTASSFVSQIDKEIIFNAESEDAVAFLWEFGDKTREVSDEPSITHAYLKEGDYLVKLTVTNKDDEENSSERMIYIGEKNEPLSAISVYLNGDEIILQEDICGLGQKAIELTRADTLDLSGGLSINKDGTTGGLKYRWVFNDGTTSSKQDIKKQFVEISYKDQCEPISLTVTDLTTGKSSTQTIYVKVKNALPTFDSFDVEIPEGNNVTPFSISLSASGAYDPDGNIVQYKWWAERETDPSEKMDLHTTTVNNTEITILPRGTEGQVNTWRFYVELKDDNGATVINTDLFGESAYIDVKNSKNLAPIVDFSMDKTSIKMGDTITFVATATDPQGEDLPKSAYKWDFDGDNIFDDTSSGPTVSRRFDQAGNFDVRLKVEHRGLVTSKTRSVVVERTSKLPLAAFTFQIAGRKVVFDASNSKYDSSVSGNTLSIGLDFDASVDSDGDGIKDNDVDSSQAKSSYLYPTEGIYRAKLFVRDHAGSEDFVIRDINIQKSGQSSEVESRIERTVDVESSSAMSTLKLVISDSVIAEDSTIDLMAFIKNADGSPYNGSVKFMVIEGSGKALPQIVKAINGEASTTIHTLGAGMLIIKVEAQDTFSGDMYETISLSVE